MVYRNPVKSTIAEFSRQRLDHFSSFASKKEFLEAATHKREARGNFAEVYENQISIGKTIFTAVSECGKPLLFISYEDMKRNILVQLMRVAHFVGLDENEETIERALCTVYSEAQVAKLGKRTKKEDFTAAALSLLNKTKVIQDIQEMDKKFRMSRKHYLNLDDHLKDYKTFANVLSGTVTNVSIEEVYNQTSK